MGGSGTGRRLVALPLAWLAGVALQLRERELMPLAAYVALAAIALAAVALLVWRLAWRRYLVVVAPLLAAAARRQRCLAGQRWTWNGSISTSFIEPPTPTAGLPGRMRRRASCASPVAEPACSSPATSSASRRSRWSRAWARLCAAMSSSCRTTAARRRRARPSSTPSGRRWRWSRLATATASAIPPPKCSTERGIAIVVGATCGAWQWRSDSKPGGSCQRDARRRYWHHPGVPIDP